MVHLGADLQSDAPFILEKQHLKACAEKQHGYCIGYIPILLNGNIGINA